MTAVSDFYFKIFKYFECEKRNSLAKVWKKDPHYAHLIFSLTPSILQEGLKRKNKGKGRKKRKKEKKKKFWGKKFELKLRQRTFSRKVGKCAIKTFSKKAGKKLFNGYSLDFG